MLLAVLRVRFIFYHPMASHLQKELNKYNSHSPYVVAATTSIAAPQSSADFQGGAGAATFHPPQYIYPHHHPFVPGMPVPLQMQQHYAATYPPPSHHMMYQPQPLQPANASTSNTASFAGAKPDADAAKAKAAHAKAEKEKLRTPIHAPGEPEGKLPYILPDKLGMALGFPSQAATIPTLGVCDVDGDVVTIRAGGVPR